MSKPTVQRLALIERICRDCAHWTATQGLGSPDVYRRCAQPEPPEMPMMRWDGTCVEWLSRGAQ